MIDGKPTYACPLCEDTGLVTCWQKTGGTLTHAMVCTCERGKVKRDRLRNVLVYDPAYHLRYTDAEHLIRLRAENAKRGASYSGKEYEPCSP